MNCLIFGPPGAGKGTLAKELVKRYNLKHISTGDEFRRHQDEKTEIGKLIDYRMNNGILIDDALTFQILKEALVGATDNILLDGFPRTLNQAIVLDDILKIDHVIALNVDEDVLRQRIEKRQKHSPRPDDDKIEKRLQEYYTKTIHTLKHYTSPVLYLINANQDAQTVLDLTIKKIEK